MYIKKKSRNLCGFQYEYVALRETFELSCPLIVKRLPYGSLNIIELSYLLTCIHTVALYCSHDNWLILCNDNGVLMLRYKAIVGYT